MQQVPYVECQWKDAMRLGKNQELEKQRTIEASEPNMVHNDTHILSVELQLLHNHRLLVQTTMVYEQMQLVTPFWLIHTMVPIDETS